MSDEDFFILVSPDSQPTGELRSCIFEERIAEANRHVENGNSFFKEKNFHSAETQYIEASYQADFDYAQQWDLTETHKNEIRTIKVRILLNVVNCSLRLEKFPHAIKCASAGLALCKLMNTEKSETAAKFFYRRAKANFSSTNYSTAIKDLKEALLIVPNDHSIRTLLKSAIEEDRKSKKENMKIWENKHIFDDMNYPQIDLIIKDDNIDEEKKFVEDTNVSQTFWCCKRKRKLQ